MQAGTHVHDGASDRAPSYFERPLPIALVFAAALLISLPLALLLLVPNFFAWLPYVLLLETIGLGTTHFFITLAVYLQAENRAHFSSSARNRLIYIAGPLAIFGLLALSEALQWPTLYPLLVMQFFRAVRFFDFFHVGRQSVGMLQIFKRPHSGAALPSRRLENAFFVGMALMQWQTFLGGARFDANNPYALAPAWLMGAIFVVVAGGYLRACLRVRAKRPWLPLAYFATQGLCSAAAVYQTRLYLVALAVHYLEYHVIMAPRLFRGPIDSARGGNRPLLWLRAHPLVFYALLASVALLFDFRNALAPDPPAATRFLVHLFDGVFLVHYFIEAFLWKFGNPFYRDTLVSLYFGPWARAAHPTAPGKTAPRTRAAWLVAVAAIAMLLLNRERLSSAAQAFQRIAIEPMHAEHHFRWGVELLQRRELRDARSHFEAAAQHDPSDHRPSEAIQWIDRQLAASTQRRPAASP
jgi:hypothetical protein